LQPIRFHNWHDRQHVHGPLHGRSGLSSSCPHVSSDSGSPPFARRCRLLLPGWKHVGDPEQLRPGYASLTPVVWLTQLSLTAGHYCPASSGAFINCPAGEYFVVSSSTMLIDCPSCRHLRFDCQPRDRCVHGHLLRWFALHSCLLHTPCLIPVRWLDAGYYCPLGSSSATQTICPAVSANRTWPRG
jgi:hypothetical protein